MAKIAILKDMFSDFEADQYVIDTNRQFGGYEPGDLICYVSPFFDVPITLNLAIRKDGALVFRSWEWSKKGNWYLHTNETPDKFQATAEQCDTVNGLFSGRIKFEGLKIDVGGTVQDICPINLSEEEKRFGKRIYLA